MKEIVVISGKGGTGKTSLTASFAVLADRPVIADCDVDAADLHLVLSPSGEECHDFYSGREAAIRPRICVGCGACATHCRFGAVIPDPSGAARFAVDPAACEGCGVCVRFCPQRAIAFSERLCGVWMTSVTRCGPLVHARLRAGAENSGKLVATVRQQAREIAAAERRSLIIIDGPPGIGCPVIAAVTGATLAVIVTEPTVSGEHDLARVLALTRHFRLPAAVCVNKWNLNPRLTERIEDLARRAGAFVAGRIRYDNAVTRAQMRARAAVEIGAACAEDIRESWTRIAALPADREAPKNNLWRSHS